MNLQLSRSFYLNEFTRSQTAARMGRIIEPTAAEIENLRRLCITVLQPLRDYTGRVITISSGLRPDWLNEAIGGSPTSQHPKGEAADANAQGMTPFQLCQAAMHAEIHFHQLILEYDQWMHISCAPLGQEARRQVLTMRYVKGMRRTYSGLVPPEH